MDALGTLETSENNLKAQRFRHVVNAPTDLRFDAYCLQKFPFLGSRSKAKKWLKKGLIVVNNKSSDPSFYPKMGDIIEVNTPPEAQKHLSLSLPIHYQDQHLAVVEKPEPPRGTAADAGVMPTRGRQAIMVHDPGQRH